MRVGAMCGQRASALDDRWDRDERRFGCERARKQPQSEHEPWNSGERCSGHRTLSVGKRWAVRVLDVRDLCWFDGGGTPSSRLDLLSLYDAARRGAMGLRTLGAACR